MPWNPFLMKKLLKNEVCGTHEQCTGALFTAEKSKHAARKKKKKKERNANVQILNLFWMRENMKFISL